MKRPVIAVLSVALMLLAGATAQASLGWQTAPILGTDYSNVTGDVVVITGPTPIDPVTGLPYQDVDGNIVLGPTIPHYSMPGDPLFGVGSPGMTVFDWTGKVANGSGINLDAGHTYDWTAVYTNLGTTYTDSSANVYIAPGTDTDPDTYAFIMLNGYLWGIGGTSTLGLGDVGNWNYTETWTDRAGGSITSSTNFSIIPEPATLVIWSLLGLTAVGFGVWRRKRAV